MQKGGDNSEKWTATGRTVCRPLRFFRIAFWARVFAITICLFVVQGSAQNKYEKRPISRIDIAISGAEKDAVLNQQYRQTVTEILGSTYSTPRIRDAIEALYNTKKIETATVAAAIDAVGNVTLTFNIKPKTQVQKVAVIVDDAVGDRVTEQELLFKLNLLQPGTAVSEQTLRNNADEILGYLHERGFYKSEVTYERRPLQNQNDVGVTFHVKPNAQATVANFVLKIEGYNKPIDESAFKLHKGEEYSRDRLTSDLATVRALLRKEDYLAPELEDPKVAYDSDTNTISIELTGKVGPKVKVIVEPAKSKPSSAVQTKLLPIKREGTLDYSAIVEGERRLENYYQEQGYFFADVTPVCSVKPPINDIENKAIANETEFLCSFLASEDLNQHEVDVTYKVDLNRRLTLSEIRLTGTNKITINDVKTALSTQEANVLGIIPLFGYGRGYTSTARLEDDRATIKSIMAELGYRDAQVRVNQGVSPNGNDLIITFVVEEGLPTVISDVNVTGNKAVKTDELLAQLPPIVGENYSRARERNAVQKLREYYSNLGYFDARVTSTMIESPPSDGKKDARIEFKVEDEGKKVVVNRIMVEGNERTETAAIVRALTLRPGELLRSADIYTSEQNLYGSDAFSRVDIKPQPAGNAPDGNRLSDIIVTVEEQPPRLMTYGGGASTDTGADGFVDIRHANLFGKLWQGGARLKVSQRQQLAQIDFVNPRFIHDWQKRFAPLTITALYQRDSTVTRFFRSAFDRGTFGIVQRVDEHGNPIDEFGRAAGSPTINRFAVSAETKRTISEKNRSVLFLRYRFEDVRLFNFESLLVKDLLRPDARNRISGVSATFARDTRRNCSVKYSLLDLISKGDQSNPCRYNASDPTNGDFLTADYSVSVPALGANIGFQKFQVSYNYFYTLGIPGIRNTTFAARAILGVGHVFSGGNRFTNAQFPLLNGLLPISERFFAGGAYTLRGFNFEEAGPRVVIVPRGTFLNSKRQKVFLDPFTIPFGGNGLAVVNVEARIPLSGALRAVPFYDGGNVFRHAGDIFKKPPAAAPNDVDAQNQRAVWTHTVGFGLRLKTPVGGDFGIDFGYLLNPPEFLIPQAAGGNAIYRLHKEHLNFRFSQAF